MAAAPAAATLVAATVATASFSRWCLGPVPPQPAAAASTRRSPITPTVLTSKLWPPVGTAFLEGRELLGVSFPFRSVFPFIAQLWHPESGGPGRAVSRGRASDLGGVPSC